MIHSLQIQKWGGPDVLRLIQTPTPSEPLPAHEIRIQVHACGVNFADLMMRMGTYPEAPRPPFIPGYEIAGIVLQVGSQVRNFEPGDRVLAVTKFGGYTSELTVSELQARKTPPGLSHREAAAIPVNFLTAWIALHEMARIRKKDRVLIQSSAGGVGMAAVQIAVQAGASVVGLVGRASKKEFVRSLGAQEVFTDQEFNDLTAHSTSPFQIILDSKGGASLKKNFQQLAPAGRLLSYGVSNMTHGPKRSIRKVLGVLLQTPLYTPFKLMMENKGVFGLNMLKFFDSPQCIQEAFDNVLEQFKNRSFQVKVEKTFPLSQGGDAQNYLQSGESIGKVVLLPSHTIS